MNEYLERQAYMEWKLEQLTKLYVEPLHEEDDEEEQEILPQNNIEIDFLEDMPSWICS